MDLGDKEIRYVIEHTEVLRAPRQKLATFGISVIHYYVLTEPVYTEIFPSSSPETVIREGKVIAQRPQIVTPYYLANLFEGFEHGQEFARYLLKKYGPYEPGLLYQYKNELGSVNTVPGTLEAIGEQICQKLDQEAQPLSAVIKGVSTLWDLSLLKFIYDFTRASSIDNIQELERMGFLDINRRTGVPRYAYIRIEELFEAVRRGESSPQELKRELDCWGLFPEYEDRFFSLFKRR